ncbi:hypothetical protein [Bradyrhizobium brasilense]|uniref:hypothetical protein n=1 Tax=Bradyrhizobium brasilense TaxID=1419277 RepID=UPI001177888F|nr:hypothetical protein [Bradyrhizobium brasilense]
MEATAERTKGKGLQVCAVGDLSKSSIEPPRKQAILRLSHLLDAIRCIIKPKKCLEYNRGEAAEKI